jgi:bifunctional enzyme CysN/CysC
MDGEAIPSAGAAQQPLTDHLRFLTCGSVDDGKSTLIGRLLHDTGQVADDQLAALARDSARFGTNGKALDFALLLDGLEAEREQGITIDVAHRYFSTPRRNFIVADTPGHEQYTRNMATGASGADAAIILVDATRGLTAQTERHSRIVSLFGIRHVILAVNKIDLVDHDPDVFRTLREAYEAFAADLSFRTITAVPISARHGDNVVSRPPALSWFDGPTLIEALEAVPVRDGRSDRPFRFVVHYVNRRDQTFRGYAGTVASGRIRPGDPIAVSPSGRTATVSRIVTWDGDLETAEAGDAVTLVLDQDIDVSRGDVFTPASDRAASVDRFAASLLWMDDKPYSPSRSLRIRIGARTTSARLTLDGDREVRPNEIVGATLNLQSAVAFDAFADEPALGAFTLIDRLTGGVVAAGVAARAVDQVSDIHPAAHAVSPAERAELNGHQGGAVWLTGLSGAGKSTIAAALERKLHSRGVRTTLLDGDNLRHGLNRDLGFSPEDRSENIRRAAEVARLFADAGVISLCAFISPTEAARAAARDRFAPDGFLEVFVDTPITDCRKRDPKGLYAKSDRGAVTGLTGVDAAWEPPAQPDLRLDTLHLSPEASADQILSLLEQQRWIPKG